MTGLEEIIKTAISRAGIVRVRSALNPFLWAFVWSVVFAILTYLFKDDSAMKFICLGLAALPEVLALGIGLAFAVKSPDRLQSEEFVIRQQELQMLYSKGEQPEIIDISDGLEKVRRVDHDPETGVGR